MDTQLIKECEEKALSWLNSPYYDDETKAEITKTRTLLLMLSIRVWSLVLAVCAVLWVPVPTA